MKKTLVAALLVSPLLVACGGGDKAPAGPGGSITSANAVATHSGPCPILNGIYVQDMGDSDEEPGEIHVRTLAQAGTFSYSFIRSLGAPRFDLADGIAHAAYNDPNPNDAYRLSCDATSITSVSTVQGEPTITIRYVALGKDRIKVETSGGAEYMDGIYLKQRQ